MPIAKIPGRADMPSMVEVFEPSRGGANDPGEIILDRFFLDVDEVRENYEVPTMNTSFRYVDNKSVTNIQFEDSGDTIGYNQAEIDTGRARAQEMAPIYDQIQERDAGLAQKRREKRVEEARKRLEIATQQHEGGDGAGDYRYEDADDKPHERLRLNVDEPYIPEGEEKVPLDLHERMGVEPPPEAQAAMERLRQNATGEAPKRSVEGRGKQHDEKTRKENEERSRQNREKHEKGK